MGFYFYVVMILIISQNHIDEPTNDVIDWLRYIGYTNVIRINGEDYHMDRVFTYDFNIEKATNEKNILYANEINTVFYRRWFQNSERKTLYNDFINNNYSELEVLLLQSFIGHLSSELTNANSAFFTLFDYKNQYWLPGIRITRNGVNKFESLGLAKKNGLKIPETIITTDKKNVIEFRKKYGKIITKPIKDVSFIDYKGIELKMYTKSITEDDIANMPECFFPCLYQREIKKKFEIRTFFLEEKFYSMAIFSQNDKTTQTDFRNYNVKKPNRNIPFKLPLNIETKLYETMKQLGLNTGSIDLLVDENNDFIFLEVNPVGQLGMVSNGGNYLIEKEIAKKLIENDEQRNKRDINNI